MLILTMVYFGVTWIRHAQLFDLFDNFHTDLKAQFDKSIKLV